MHTVTGITESRLEELRKYVRVGSLSQLYVTSTNSNVDGLNPTLSSTGITASTYVYYIGGITYTDTVLSGSTTTVFTFNSLGLNDPNNFDNYPVIKYDFKQNMVENSQVSKDVFIVRQQLPVFEKNYRLRAINSLNDVLRYAGGDYFKIYNNT